MKMSTRGLSVRMTADAYIVCVTHALSTEKEEIMGLLIGEVGIDKVCYIYAVMLLRRSCKQADRVEISPEQLSAASTHAEALGHQLDRPMRVVGWYHSHPHITVWPSHIDVRTQADWQLMDTGFMGLIFSIFNHDKTSKLNRIQLSCFQAVQKSFGTEWERVEIEIHVKLAQYMSDVSVETIVNLLSILWEEEEESYGRVSSQVVLSHSLMSCLHNGSVYTNGLVHVDQSMFRPLLEAIEQRHKNSVKRTADLRASKKRLKQELAQLSALTLPGKVTTC